MSKVKEPKAACSLTYGRHHFSILFLLMLYAFFMSSIYTRLFENSESSMSKAEMKVLPLLEARNLSVNHKWSHSNNKEFCKELINDPRKPDRLCSRDPETMFCKNGSVTMFSQHGQDYYLYTRHFRYLKRKGVYLDVAANEPVDGSTTYFYDSCLGWSGVCVEPNEKYFSSLISKRSCRMIPTCVSDQPGSTVSFVSAGAVGGVLETNKNMNNIRKRRLPHHVSSMKCTNLATVLLSNRMKNIDYFSLDVEGHELNVLEGIDWNNVTFNVISVEVSEETRMPISQFLIRKGYKQHSPIQGDDNLKINNSLLSEDAFFIHKSVSFGYPQ